MAVKGIYSLQGRTRVNRVVQLSVYYNSTNANNFCASSGNDYITIYTPTLTTLVAIFNDNANIYTDSGLTTEAPSGYYSVLDGGDGTTWYQWTSGGSGSDWTGSGTCGD